MKTREQKIATSSRRTREMRAVISEALTRRRDLLADYHDLRGYDSVLFTLLDILTGAVMREVRRDKRGT